MQTVKPKLCFGDLPELDHVIDLLDELASVASDERAAEFVENSPLPGLLKCLDDQIEWQRNISNEKFPGAFDRSYLAEEYAETWDLLHELKYYPWELPAKRSELVLRLHRVMILGNLTGDELCRMMEEINRLSGGLAAAKHRIEAMRKPAEVGEKSLAGSAKGNSRREDPQRDEQIFKAVKSMRNKSTQLPLKTIRSNVGESFGIGVEAVRKAEKRHAEKNSK